MGSTALHLCYAAAGALAFVHDQQATLWDIAGAAQEWADRFERFVRAHPDMWQFWLDKRWRRWLASPAASDR